MGYNACRPAARLVGNDGMGKKMETTFVRPNYREPLLYLLLTSISPLGMGFMNKMSRGSQEKSCLKSCG